VEKYAKWKWKADAGSAAQVSEGQGIMITREYATQFANEWIEAWNAHDLGRILSHYSDDFEMSTPFIAMVMGVSEGTLRGKEAVGAYWKRALEKIPDLRFELIEVFFSVSSICIQYKSVLGLKAIEWLYFQNGKVVKAIAHYDSLPEKKRWEAHLPGTRELSWLIINALKEQWWWWRVDWLFQWTTWAKKPKVSSDGAVAVTNGTSASNAALIASSLAKGTGKTLACKARHEQLVKPRREQVDGSATVDAGEQGNEHKAVVNQVCVDRSFQADGAAKNVTFTGKRPKQEQIPPAQLCIRKQMAAEGEEAQYQSPDRFAFPCDPARKQSP
jgi:hypothetical protein